MRCDQFQSRMDQLLDGRESPERDPQLVAHSEQCDACERKLVVWKQIDQIIDEEFAVNQRRHGLASNPVSQQQPDQQDRDQLQRNLSAAPVIARWQWIAVAASLFIIGNIALSHQSQRRTGNAIISQAIEGADQSSAKSLVGNQDPFLQSGKPAEEDVVESSKPAADQIANPLLSWQRESWWSMVDDAAWVRHTRPAVDSVRAGVAPLGRSMRRALAILMIQTQSLGATATPAPNSDNGSLLQEQTSLAGRSTYVIA